MLVLFNSNFYKPNQRILQMPETIIFLQNRFLVQIAVIWWKNEISSLKVQLESSSNVLVTKFRSARDYLSRVDDCYLHRSESNFIVSLMRVEVYHFIVSLKCVLLRSIYSYQKKMDYHCTNRIAFILALLYRSLNFIISKAISSYQ